MKLYRYDFSEYTRRSVPQALTDVRPKGVTRFYTRRYESAPVIEEITLDELLRSSAAVYAANAYLADQVVSGEDRLDEYRDSIVQIYGPADVPGYAYSETMYCHCGCGRNEGTYTMDCVEFMVVP